MGRSVSELLRSRSPRYAIDTRYAIAALSRRRIFITGCTAGSR